MRKIWGAAAVVLAILAGATVSRAQTVSPVILEYREKAKGSFQITNDTVVPMSVSVEPRSFSVDPEGNPKFRKLDEQIKVRLSSTSFRLGPRQTFTIFYDATAQKLPVWFTIYSTVTGPPNPNGLQLAVELPHTVYLLTKKPFAREAVAVLSANFKTTPAPAVEAEIDSRSPDFARVQLVQLFSGAQKQEYGGFPLFPGQHRLLSLEWQLPGAPQRMVLVFEKFKVEQVITTGSPAPHGDAPSAKISP
ncbi:MAG: hypothetical protein GZ088_02980 [Acidipila sp.]|nr:hypothetical protein [Acidipila sp.]